MLEIKEELWKVKPSQLTVVIGVSAFHSTDMSNTATICVFQILTVSSSVPLKVSAALSAAKEAGYSLEDLLQREQIISNLLNQV